MSGTHQFTLEEYKNIKHSLDTLYNMIEDVKGYRQEIKSSYYQPAYFSDLETWKIILKKLDGPWAEWKGEDADAYRATAQEICDDIDKFHEEYVDVLDQLLQRMEGHYDQLLEAKRKCEDGQMTLGGNIVVQGAQLLGFEVE